MAKSFCCALMLAVAGPALALGGCGGSSVKQVPAVPFESHPQFTFFVSPQGNDANPGTFAEPFATPARAQDAVRDVNSKMHGDIVVYLREGTYTLSKTWSLDERDSGMNRFRVIWAGYPGEHAYISGGTHIENWTENETGRWTAQTSLDNFRQLYVNDVRVVRGRSGPLNSPTLFGDSEHVNGVAGFRSLNPEMASWKNPQDIELGFFLKWTHMICGVQDLSGNGTGVSITMKQPCFYLIQYKVGTQAQFPSYVENALELTNSPGQFYLDRSEHRVYYVPRPGEDMRNADAVAPLIQTLVTVSGTIDSPVTNITFENLTFEHSSWLMTSQFGFPEVQADFTMSQDLGRMYTDFTGYQRDVNNEFQKTPGAIVLTYAHNVTFERCTFKHLGGSGIDLQLGSQNDTVSGGTFYDISANAIQVGDVQANDHHPTDVRMILSNNQVLNSYIHDVGVEYLGSVAIFVGYTDGTVIAHNEITRAPYTGVSVGWGWGMEDPGYTDTPVPYVFTTPTPSQNNIVQFNDIHGIMQYSSDGGGIYTLGSMPGTVISSNLVHDDAQPPGGIYLDNGSRGITVTNDVVFGMQPAWGQLLPIFTSNLSPAEMASCSIYGNYTDNPAQAVILSGQAGLQPAYQDLLK